MVIFPVLQTMAVKLGKNEGLIFPSPPNNLEKKFLLSPSNMLTFVLCMTCMQPAKLGQSYMVNDLTLTFVKLHILRLRTYKHKSVERKFNTVVL